MHKITWSFKGYPGEVIEVQINMRSYKGDIGDPGLQGPMVNRVFQLFSKRKNTIY
jgi:hypothetical protein